MHLNTYESAAIPDVFVTLPSNEAPFVIAMVDTLTAMQLRLFRGDYTVSGEPADLEFLELVTTRIADKGYALHGFDLAVGRGDGGDPPMTL
jgi:hypothetical protein